MAVMPRAAAGRSTFNGSFVQRRLRALHEGARRFLGAGVALVLSHRTSSARERVEKFEFPILILLSTPA
jgi:NADH-quinone oxidoreductase subunit N